MTSLPSKLQEQLSDCRQEHLLKFWDVLSADEQKFFALQLSSIDFELFLRLREQKASASDKLIAPCDVVQLDDAFQSKGVASIQNGELGVLTVAGGQGTRLGWSGPKGTFPATPITGKSLFQIIAEQIVFASKKYSVVIPWYIMTSNENDEATRSFLLDNNCFGLKQTDIFIFTQNEIPAVDAEGNMLLATKNSVAMNPDGHGGVVSALKQSGGLEEMSIRGIKHLSYVQVDNPLANVIDPDFIGLHLSDKSSQEASSKCVPKITPEERVGVFCNVAGNIEVVEYIDLPADKANQVHADGELLYGAGSIAVHLFSVDFLQRIANDLPWHLAHKKVQYVHTETGDLVSPPEPNAYKFEKFVFDVLPMAKSSLVVATKREDEFAPIKNATGQDSGTTSHQLQQARALRWLCERGVDVEEGAKVEISPLSGMSAKDLDASVLPTFIASDEVVVI